MSASAVPDEVQGIVTLMVAQDLAAKFPDADERQVALIKAAAANASILGTIEHDIKHGRCTDDVAGRRTAVTMDLAALLLELGPLDRIADTIALRTFADAYRAITDALATQPAAGSA